MITQTDPHEYSKTNWFAFGSDLHFKNELSASSFDVTSFIKFGWENLS